MHESAEVNYREIQYGQRLPDGRVNPLQCGPNQAAMYRSAGHDIVQRERTVYRDDVTEWHGANLPERVVSQPVQPPPPPHQPYA